MPDLKLVPLPSECVQATSAVWMPFVVQIAERARCHVGQLVVSILSNEIQLLIAWDDETKTAKALAGSRIKDRGDQRIGEIVWATGEDKDDWFHLLGDIEMYHRDHLRCAGMVAIARPGWSRPLKSQGYRMTHVVFEKDF